MKQLLYSTILVFTASFCSAQTIITFAGTGTAGYSGDTGPATAAMINHVAGIDVDTSGNLYIPDYDNNRIRKVTPAGIITTIAGTGIVGYNGDGGPATDAQIANPWNVVTDKAGNIYFCEHGNNIIRKIDAAGIISTFAGNTTLGYSGDGGPATDASFLQPADMTVDNVGNVYVGDGNNVIRKIDTLGIVTTFAGNGSGGYNGDGIPATAASINNPVSIVWANGNLYIGDNLNNRIRKVDSSGIISTVAGDGTAGYSGDGGAATAARINGPVGLGADAAGNIYWSEYSNETIRKMTGATIQTIAGNGSNGFGGDGGNPLLAQLSHPWGIAVDKYNNVFIADGGNDRVRKVIPVTTGVTEIPSDNKISIYPNPANTQIIIRCTEKINKVVVRNILGQIVINHDYNTDEVTMNVAGLPPGFYMIKINSSEAGKFIKQ